MYVIIYIYEIKSINYADIKNDVKFMR